MNDRTDKIEAELADDRARLRENVEQLSEKLSPGRLLDEALGALGQGPGEFASGLGGQLRDKPLPAILTAVGLAWLMMGERQPRGQQRTGNGWDYPTREELDAHSAWESYQETSWALIRDPNEDDMSFERRLMENRARTLGVTRRNDEDEPGFKQRVGEAAEKTKRFAAMCRDKIAGAAKSAAHGVAGAASGAAHAAKSGAHVVSGAAKSGAHAVSDAAGATARRSAQFYDEHPLATGAMGVALGAIVGAALPLSRVEEEKLKGLVDEGLSRGAEGVSGAARAVGTFADDVETAIRPS